MALAAALAARAAAGEPWSIVVVCDAGTHQNGRLAAVPGCGGRAGLELAAALGAVGGDPDRALDVLAGVGPEARETAANLAAGGAVSVTCDGASALSIRARVESDRFTGEARLEGHHLHLVRLGRDGEPLPPPAWAAAPGDATPATLDGALALADAVDVEDEAWLVEGLARNVEAAGDVALAGLDAPEAAAALAEAASRARMTGAPVAVTTSGWSGNQGLVATLPLRAVAPAAGRAALARAAATSHLVGHLLREGSPSPLCHALLAASAGAAAGCARLLGGDRDAVERAVALVVASAGAAGCDGAKPGCALRVGLAAGQAVRCARRAVAGPVDVVGGLVGATVEETARRVARVASRAAREPACGA